MTRRPTHPTIDPLIGRLPTAPIEAPEPNPMVSIARSVRFLRWVIVAVAIPAVAAVTLGVRYVSERAETAVNDRHAREQLVRDVKDVREQLAEEVDDLRKRYAEVAKALRDAEESLRMTSQRLRDHLERRRP